MKKEFFDLMHSFMEQDPDICLILVGLGWPRVDEFLEKYPGRAINTEASEQTALDIAVGLAYAGKVPVVYTIAPFYYRAWETLRTYIDHEKLHVVLVGVGRDEEYGEHDGFSHSASDISKMFNTLPNFHQYYPENSGELFWSLEQSTGGKEPCLINIHR